MDIALSDIIRLNQFSTNRRQYAFSRVLEIAKATQVPQIQALVEEAIAFDKGTYALEQRWATRRRTGKPSAKQLKAQKHLQTIDGRVDRTLTGLRDSALDLIKGADEEDERELIHDVEHFIHEICPNGVHAVTSLRYEEELVAVNAIVAKLKGELEPLVAKLGLTVNANRLAKLAVQYDAAQKDVDTLEFGQVKAARAEGQNYLLRIVAKILGTFDKPTGDHAEKRSTLLGPIVAQNESIRDHIRARRSVPDVDPETGEEQSSEGVEGAENSSETA